MSNQAIRFGSVCSGIEAASVAWHPLGWKAAWLSEIEPFPSAVLKHHYPDVPNLGDMTTLPERISSGEVEAPDLFCGGTPCQAFSVAGLRKSLDDARGNLSLVFCEIANAIDNVRVARGDAPAIVFWENVPGVLSTKDNAFGCFLAGLAGEDTPLEPAGGKWTNAGVVLGPQRAVAWRILDAQYFGVAQRRRRVFVVASARDGFDSASVLLEFDGVRRDSAPSREAGKVAPTIPSRSTAGGGLGTDFDLDGGVIQQTVGTLCAADGKGKNGQDAYDGKVFAVTQFGDTAGTLTARHDSSPCADRGMNVVAQPISYGIRTANTSSNGWGVQEEVTHTLDTTQGVAVAQPIAFHPTQDPISSTDGTTHAMGTGSEGGCATVAVAQPIPFDTTQITSPANYSKPQAGDPCHPLAAGAHAPAIAQPVAVGTDTYNGAITGDVAATLGTQSGDGVSSGPSVMQPVAVALRGREGGATAELGDEVQNCLRASSGGGDKPHVLTAMQVRRLTPVECERLQGFPDSYTQIPWRNKPADQCPDGPRYKALGNSWAVPVVRWIGSRIQARLDNPAAHFFSPDSKLSLHQQT